MDNKNKAKKMLNDWKKDDYAFGMDVLDRTGDLAARAGRTAVLVGGRTGGKNWIEPVMESIKTSLKKNGIKILSIITGAAPNTPREDVYRIANQIGKKKPDSIIAVGGGSTIDAVKAANVLSVLEPDNVEAYFGTGMVTERLNSEGKKLPAVIAIQTAASSAAHLTKYSNITDPLTGQKKLIIDDAIIPPMAVFDYRTTMTALPDIKIDGAMDGISHCLEVVCGATGKPFFDKVMEIADTGISLIVNSLPESLEEPENETLLEKIGLGTDLGGYAIMVGGTNYGHLFSFSLVNKLTHGRACAIANPYVIVFFAPAIEPQLRMIGNILSREGFIKEEIEKYQGRDLGLLVSRGMIEFLQMVKFPTSFGQVGVDQEDKERILSSAKNPQLWSKLEQAPVSLIARYGKGGIDEKNTENNIDIFMGSLLDAIISGDLDIIKNMS